MQQEELEALSREAAGCLPEDWRFAAWDRLGTPGLIESKDNTLDRSGNEYYPQCWLHESTEACAEIMVRVLWPANYCPIGNMQGCWIEAIGMQQGAPNWYHYGMNPMLAYRVAVLTALIALKGPQP